MEAPKRYLVVVRDMLWVHAQSDSIEEARSLRDGIQDDFLEDIFIYDTADEEYVQ
jgi:isocitrate lyase